MIWATFDFWWRNTFSIVIPQVVCFTNTLFSIVVLIVQTLNAFVLEIVEVVSFYAGTLPIFDLAILWASHLSASIIDKVIPLIAFTRLSLR